MILITVGLIMFTSYFGGHVFDEMFPTIIMSVFIYLFLSKIQELKEMNNKVSLIIPVYNMENILKDA